jgi:peptide/nickel transport system substrate-binding protein
MALTCRCRFFGLIALLALGLTGCSRQEEATPESTTSPTTSAIDQTPVTGDWVIERIGNDPDTLNPITGQDAQGEMIRYPDIFESLLFLDNYTLQLKPLVAESYEISPDKLIYTFHLRHDVKWQDGKPLTAEDVKFSYDKVMDPKVDAADKRSYFDTVKSCEVLDPYTIRFTTTQPYFKTLEVLGTLPIVPKHILEKGEPDFNKHPFGRDPVGSGPYKFVRWDTGSQIVLERDPNYWGGPGHYPNRLVYQVIQEPYATAQLLKKGEIDVVDGMSPIQWERELAGTRSASRLNEIVYPYPAYSYLGFNMRKPIFADVRVRHAIDLLIPRDKILAQIFLNKYATTTSGYDPPTSPNYNHDVAPTPYDPTLAMQLLNEAGWKNDHGDGLLYKDGKPFSFGLLYPSGNPNSGKVVELIQESLGQAGIKIVLERLEFTQLFARAGEWDFDAMMGGWALDVNSDPAQLWAGSEAVIKKSSNFVGYNNPEANKLITEGKLEYDPAKRAAIYRELQKVIYNDYPVCFLFNPKVILLVSKRFQNVKIFTPRPCFDITTWWVPKDQQKYGN